MLELLLNFSLFPQVGILVGALMLLALVRHGGNNEAVIHKSPNESFPPRAHTLGKPTSSNHPSGVTAAETPMQICVLWPPGTSPCAGSGSLYFYIWNYSEEKMASS